MPPPPTAYDPVDQFGRAVAAQTPGFTVEVALARTTMRTDKDKLGFTVEDAALILGIDSEAAERSLEEACVVHH